MAALRSRQTLVATDMGYDVHITRKNNWYDEDGPEIGLPDWVAYVANDPEMRMDGYAEATFEDGGVFRVESQGLAVWTAYSRNGEGGNMAWFSYERDRVTVKNPDPEILVKMFLIAEYFAAKVQGDDCERYGPDGTVAKGQAQSPIAEKSPKPWWKFWF